MRCTACGTEQHDSAHFCGACGAPLVHRCPTCDADVAPGVRYCTSCGSALDEGEAMAREAPGQMAERRRVSVLFVDLEGFTSLAETLDPEEVRAVQSRYFEVARSVIARFGGTVEKFIGDAVVAIWGAPVAHEDDPERAVLAALNLVRAIGRLGGTAARHRLAGRASVATGEVAVNVGAVGQGLVAGDLVNVASRLQGHAPSGGVLVDEATRLLARASATYEPMGELDLTGRSTPVAASVASALPAPSPILRGSHGGPFVGREHELRELLGLQEGVVRDGRSRLVSITGIAGIGKSRLAWELAGELDRRPALVAWHAGRAPAYGDGITFAAVADMVRHRIDAPAGTVPEITRRQLAGAIGELVRDEGERAWLEPRLMALLGDERLDAFERDDLFAAWRRFFERVAETSPAVLVFEDLQWADPALLDFVEHLATWTRRHPILVVTLARPELLDQRPSWGAGVGRFTAIHLERLPDAAMRGLLAQRAPELDGGVVDEIVRHAGGVPLYAVEVARSVADAAAPHERRSARRVADASTGSIAIPDSLHGLVAARIDALPSGERQLL
jgi:class 3 adenylate cyclase